MARMATRIASGLAAAGIATIMAASPAQASFTDPGSACSGPSCTASPTNGDDAAWVKIALGVAGGVALVGAGAATVSSRNRREHHQPHPA